MPFAEPETAFAATIVEAGREYILRKKIRALRGWDRVFTNFQQLTRRLNDLAGIVPGSSENQSSCARPDSRGRLSLHKPSHITLPLQPFPHKPLAARNPVVTERGLRCSSLPAIIRQ